MERVQESFFASERPFPESPYLGTQNAALVLHTEDYNVPPLNLSYHLRDINDRCLGTNVFIGVARPQNRFLEKLLAEERTPEGRCKEQLRH